MDACTPSVMQKLLNWATSFSRTSVCEAHQGRAGEGNRHAVLCSLRCGAKWDAPLPHGRILAHLCIRLRMAWQYLVWRV